MIRPGDATDGDPTEGTARAGDPEVAPTAAPIETGEPCDVCGAPMYGRHCKLVCSNCGYLRDCSDP